MIKNKHIKIISKPLINFLKFRILHVDDSPHRIALGAALGLFVAYMPPLGYHIVLVMTLAFLLRANKAVALAWIWISNPFTVVIIHYPCYLLGNAVLGWLGTSRRLAPDEVVGMINNFSFGNTFTHFYTAQFWQQLGKVILQIGIEMFIGGLILGTIFATAAYFAIRYLITFYREKHPRHKFHKIR